VPEFLATREGRIDCGAKAHWRVCYPSQFSPFDTPLDLANNGLAAVTATQL